MALTEAETKTLQDIVLEQVASDLFEQTNLGLSKSVEIAKVALATVRRIVSDPDLALETAADVYTAVGGEPEEAEPTPAKRGRHSVAKTK